MILLWTKIGDTNNTETFRSWQIRRCGFHFIGERRKIRYVPNTIAPHGKLLPSPVRKWFRYADYSSDMLCRSSVNPFVSLICIKSSEVIMPYYADTLMKQARSSGNE